MPGSRYASIRSVASALLLTLACNAACATPGGDAPEGLVERSDQSRQLAQDCQFLGPVTVRVDCQCYDKLSYEKMRANVLDRLSAEAISAYPENNQVLVWDVRLYLNQAIARGAAFRCPSLSSR